MSEYIEREAAIKEAKKPSIYDLTDVPEWLSYLPAADVAPVVHGDWWGIGNMVMCTVCHKETYCTTNYCPNCGARMDGE